MCHLTPFSAQIYKGMPEAFKKMTAFGNLLQISCDREEWPAYNLNERIFLKP
jgi:hypothetical protein